ncbi:hypothetical protein B0T10DRAFT_603504 [Thelonectria olida]|uniref:C2H2-type domain-containing protein n=1 Tax=Thelonectria olida TaxID=1576542 RepID=A0A9P8WF56_9HYPO|nr:hypothetical protein B0T10DRAFT_603504 [Thelonectria olida]
MEDYKRIFHEAVARFVEESSDQQIGKFRTASMKSVKAQIVIIQRDQEKAKAMVNFNRFASFLQAMGHFEDAIKALNMDIPDLSVYLWGPPKVIFEFAKEDATTLDSILDSYDKFGQHLPVVSEYKSQLTTQPNMKICLSWMYDDLLRFNSIILGLFKTRSWKKTFLANWRDMEANSSPFQTLIRSFDVHTNLLKQSTELQHHRATLETHRNLNDHIMRYNRDHGELLMNSRSQEEINQKLNDYIMGYRRDRDELLASAREQDQDRKYGQYIDVTKWLKSPGEERSEIQYQNEFSSTRSEHPETGKWFLAEDPIRDWMDSDIPDFPILWVHGKKGAGKTIIASLLIEHLIENYGDRRKCSYFYCRESHQSLKEPRVFAIKKSLLRQMVAHNRDLLPTLYEKRMNSHHILADEKTANTLLDLFCDINMNQFIVIDGLDELTETDRRSLLKQLEAMVAKCEEDDHPEKIRVMILSTDSSAIRERLAQKDKDCHRVGEYQIRRSSSEKDIQIYVSKRVEKLGQKYYLSPDDLEMAISKTCENSEGMMLYAFLVTDNLIQQPDARWVLHELGNEFPKGLEGAYEKIINRLRERIHENTWKEASKIFGWLSYAKRPLKLHELQAATSINVDVNEDGSARIQDIQRLVKPIEDVCGSLVHIIGGERIEFIHETAKRFIMKKENLDGQALECDLLVICLRYLSLSCFRKSLQSDGRERFAKKGYYAFQDYAISEWFEHLKGVIRNSTDIFYGPSKGLDYRLKISGALQSFYTQFRTDLETVSQEQRDQEADGIAEATRDCAAFAQLEFYQPLLGIWKHVLMHHKRHTKKQSQVSIKDLGDALKGIRKVLERLVPQLDEKDPIQPQRTLREFYGHNIFKCTRVTCAFFYEGFESEESRKLHDARHDRSFLCEAPECMYATFGFSSSRDRENHYTSTHPERASRGPVFPSFNAQRADARHQCDDCPKSFTRAAALIAHRDSAHLMRKPFSCSTCGRDFTRNNDRRRHEKLHLRRRRT